MATMTIYLAGGPYYATGLIRLYPHFFAVSYQMPWVFGPLVYLYARAASDRCWRFTRRSLVHFVPVTISIVAILPYYAMSGAEKIAAWERVSVSGLGGVIGRLDPLKYALGIVYSAATVVYLVQHRRDVQRRYSNLAHVNLRWLLWLSAATAAIWILVTALKVGHVSTAVRDGHVAVAMALLVYRIGYMGLRQPEIFRYEILESAVPAAGSDAASIVTVSEPMPASRRNRRSTKRSRSTRIKRRRRSVERSETRRARRRLVHRSFRYSADREREGAHGSARLTSCPLCVKTCTARHSTLVRIG
jgi:hypothetical protein